MNDYWIETVELIGTGHEIEEGAPKVHATERLRINGEDTSVPFLPEFGWTMNGGSQEGTVLSFVTEAHAVTIGSKDSEGVYRPHLIGPYRVLVPLAQPWEVCHVMPKAPGEESRDVVRVYVFVREAAVVQPS